MTLRRRLAYAGAGLTAVGLLVAGLLVPLSMAPAESAGTYRVTATRDAIAEDGTSTTLDQRTVSMDVSQTTNLRGRQQVTVSWSGAHPTGGTVADVNSAAGAGEEYPFVLLQCRGTASGDNAVRPETCWTQTWAERFQRSSSAWPVWRADAYADTDARGSAVGAPDPRPELCFGAARSERWLPFDAVDGTTYAGGSAGCAGMAPESANVDGSGLPSNTTYGITGSDGKGSEQFTVFTADENASLGCSSEVPCSLVAVPVMGVSCDGFGTKLPEESRPTAAAGARADTLCRAPDVYQPGQIATTGTDSNLAVSGSLWWAPSNWRNRITVPLTFAVSSSVCSVLNSDAPLTAYGSVLFSDISAQWTPKFCTDDRLRPFVHVQAADTAARNLITAGTASMVLSSRAPDGGFGKPVVQAPVAFTGFAVAYNVDDSTGRPAKTLNLDARLLAKLLTQSYPANSLVGDNYPALARNPMNITKDPEFIALNPGLPQYDAVEAASTIMTLSTETDMTAALTSYIDADPEARKWLDGVPDPWGMVVNPNYLRIDLPVSSWPQLDEFVLPQSIIDAKVNPCYSYSPSPYLGLIANPTGFVQNVVQNIQYSMSNVNIACPNGDSSDVTTLRLRTQGRQQPGNRFVLGVVPLTAAYRYSLRTASLQTTSDVSASDKVADAAGRTFVAADDAGLKAAGALLKPDEESGTWDLDYAQLHETAGAAAYPGALPVYADVPTTGLDKATAKRAAQLLEYAATSGQQAGTGNGQLPPGALPLTEANGLSALAAYTHRAAAAVLDQKGEVPKLVPDDPDPTPSPTGEPTDDPTTTSPVGPGTTTPLTPPATGGSPSAGKPGKGATPKPAETDVIRTVGAESSFGGIGLPVVLLAGLVVGVAGLSLRFTGRAVQLGRTAGPALARRVRSGGRRVRR
ncbi:hypothetical protein ASC77_09015 [Nocardioides sp. Root1257]|uniref:hypothetical protein n=1 Tax=unclassified Nocardioides TaxID=2615069 RepID=UPI0006FA7D02|nr:MULTISPECIES: hypothetical protein [unclassified Nocardioides]KQW48856.1 hypothetical protein ASC77_09015 [Nocardioides sp. Root1257]KRC48031.1 hypothetical protein ASE24_09020 [Nocardioides sp. Root224]